MFRILSVVLLMPLFILIASDEALGISTAQELSDFCTSLSSIESSWRKERMEEESKPSYIGKNDNLKAIEKKYKEMEKTAWDNFTIDGVKGEITGLTEYSGAVGLSVLSSCNNANHRMNHGFNSWSSGGANKNIKEGSPVYEALKKFKVGDTVFVSGYLADNPNVTTVDMATGSSTRANDLKTTWSHSFVFEGVGKTAAECRMVAQEQRIADKEIADAKQKKDQKNIIVQGSKAKKELEEKIVRPLVEKIDDALYKK